LVQDDGVWYNFLDAQDVIAYPLQVLFKDAFNVEDIVVQTGTNPRKAHDGYWENAEVADFIAGRLKLDFLRINGTAASDDLVPTGVADVEPTASDMIDPTSEHHVVKEDDVPDEVSLVKRLFDL
jgi:hypothetical protein